MDKMLKRPSGYLYRLESNHKSYAAADGITLSNGIAFSPKGDVLYFTDSPTKNIFAYDLDAKTGALSHKRIFARTTALPGIPDGATVDADYRLDRYIDGISGATLSVDALTRLGRLALYLTEEITAENK